MHRHANRPRHYIHDLTKYSLVKGTRGQLFDWLSCQIQVNEEKKRRRRRKKNPNFCASIRRKKIMRLCPLNPPAVTFRRHLQDTNWINLLLIVKCSLSVDRGGAPTRSISISLNLNVPTRSPEGSRGGRNRCRQIWNGTRPRALVQNQHTRELK